MILLKACPLCNTPVPDPVMGNTWFGDRARSLIAYRYDIVCPAEDCGVQVSAISDRRQVHVDGLGENQLEPPNELDEPAFQRVIAKWNRRP